ncbi:MAG: hypothetical protein RIB64_16320 [Arenibacter algicola]
MEISIFLWAGGRKGKRYFRRLCFPAAEGVVQTWNGKTSQADWQRVSGWGGL